MLSDNGSSGPAGTNWAQYSGGLLTALSAGTSGATCGSGGSCGDVSSGTTCAYDAGHPGGIGATSFACTVGGSSFRLYPQNFTGKTSSGYITFAVRAK